MVQETKWTDAQLAAISHRNGGAVVSAGAGSGKTAVLTQRVVSIICDRESHVDPSAIAIVTFTEKAAEELKVRLHKLMRERIAQNPQDAAFLRMQELKLRNARISTISSFCFGIIRDNIEYSPLSPGFSVMDEVRAALLKSAVADSVLEDFYRDGSEQEKSVALEQFTAKDDRALAELIIMLHDFCCNLTNREGWEKKCTDEVFFAGIKERIKKRTEFLYNLQNDCFESFGTAIAETVIDDPDKQGEYLDALKNSFLAAAKLMRDNGYTLTEEAQLLIDSAPARAKPAKDENIKFRRDEYRSAWDKFLKYCVKLSDFDGDMKQCLPSVSLLLKLTAEFSRRYSEEKLAQNSADFSDAECGVYKMLCEHPEIKEKTSLDMIIVDEFQDSNRLQYEIFTGLSDNCRNLYFVGDIKQSIYGFRGAQPEVFAEICHDKVNYTELPLNRNFRSKENIINGVNAIFDRIMSEKTGGVDYMNEGRLECGRSEKASPEDITEVCVIVPPEKGLSGSEAEAEYVAARIRNMIDSGYRVFDRPCTENDFAIIIRSPKSKLDIYKSALKRHGLNSDAKENACFTEQPEIAVMLDYLRVIDNPFNDDSLARLLMSPIFGYSAEELSRIRTGTCGMDIKQILSDCPDEIRQYAENCRRKPLFSCLHYAACGFAPDSTHYPIMAELFQSSPELFGKADSRCREFETDLARLRSVMASVSPAKLIQTIYDTTDTLNLLLISENPAQRMANLSLLIQYAQSYSEYNGGGIISDFLNNLAKTDARSGMLRAADTVSGAGGVKIMSVHASKGLQFPVVFICDCAKSFNTQDIKNDIIFSEQYGLAVKSVNKALMSKIPSPAFSYAADELRDRISSEEMRLLYVAATRAEEKLIFTGYRSKGLQDCGGNSSSDKASVSGTSYLSWLLELTELKLDNKTIDPEHGIITSDYLKFSEHHIDNADSNTDDTVQQKERAYDTDTADDIAKQIQTEYRYAAFTQVAAKYTATELAANSRIANNDANAFSLYVSKPAFMKEDNKKLSGKKRGDAYHKLMENIPFDRTYTASDIERYISDRTAEYLNDKERACITPCDISAFFDTDIAQRMLKSDKVYREFPVFHKLDTSKLTAAQLGVDESIDFSEAEPYIQGIADMFFIENGGIVLVDYKSDSFSDEEHLLNDYSFQLTLYRDALETAFDLPVKEMYIYSFRLNKMIEVI